MQTEELEDENNALRNIFSGTFIFSPDGDCVMDVFHRNKPSNKILRETIATLDKTTEIYQRWEDDRSGGSTRKQSQFADYDKPGSLGRIFNYNVILGLLDQPAIVVKRRGSEEMLGQSCQIFECTLSTGKHTMSTLVWIDLASDGWPVLKTEFHRDGLLWNRMEVLETKKFGTTTGSFILPILGTHASYVLYDDKINEFVGKKFAVNRDRVVMLANTVKFNIDVSKDRFTVKLKDGAIINDQLKKARYEFGKQRKEIPKATKKLSDAEHQLKEALLEAERQRDELDASASPNPAWFSSYKFTILFFVSLMILIGVFLYKRTH